MQREAYLVGVAGGSGSGKTSLVRALRESLPEGLVSVVSQDDYYFPKDRQAVDGNGQINFDLPTAIDLDTMSKDLRLLVNGDAIYRPEYTFNNDEVEPRWLEVKPSPVVLVEGLFVLHHEPTRKLFDLRVFIEATEESQLKRRLKRDAVERGYSEAEVRYQWNNHVMPAYRNFLLPYRHHCDLHVVNEAGFERALAVLRNHLMQVAGVNELLPQPL